jgi:hypothetical protein
MAFLREMVSVAPGEERAGHLMCDEIHLKAGIFWNVKTHEMMGFASDDGKGLNLLDELKSLDTIMTDDDTCMAEDEDFNAQKVNQWRFRSVKRSHAQWIIFF